MAREYLDVDIPLNLKGRLADGNANVGVTIEFLRDSANRLIRPVVEHYRAQGWTPERSIDVLHIYRDKRLNYKKPFVRWVLVSARITFHRETK